MANLDIITTPWLVKLRYVGTHPFSFAVSTKGNRFGDFLFASRDDEVLQNGSTFKGKKS